MRVLELDLQVGRPGRRAGSKAQLPKRRVDTGAERLFGAQPSFRMPARSERAFDQGLGSGTQVPELASGLDCQVHDERTFEIGVRLCGPEEALSETAPHALHGTRVVAAKRSPDDRYLQGEVERPVTFWVAPRAFAGSGTGGNGVVR